MITWVTSHITITVSAVFDGVHLVVTHIKLHMYTYICVCITYIIKPMDGVPRKHMMFSLASLSLPIAANQTGVTFFNFKHQFRLRSILLNNNCHVIPLLDDVFVLNVHNNLCYSQFLSRDDLMQT